MGPARLQERYEIQSEIASGGMATVYHGRIVGPGGFSRQVAIKRLHAQFAKDPEFVAMFMDEARIAARIQHRNVVPTLDVVLSRGELFLIMEHVTGISLARLLRAVRQPPLPIGMAIAAGICHGLHAAHEAVDQAGNCLHIVHRDVSPHNVMISEDGTARVVDFGIAKAVDALHATRDGSIKGKLPYMPCEQLEGAVLDRRTDVYAAAAVVWEMLTGRRLISASTDAAIVTAIQNHHFEPPSQFNPFVSEELDAIVMKGLARAREQRHATCRAMADAIEECCEVAPPGRVADWLETQFGDELAGLRAARIEQAESKRSETLTGPARGPSEQSPAQPEGGAGHTESTSLTARGSIPEPAGADPSRSAVMSAVSSSTGLAARRVAWIPAAVLVALGGLVAFLVLGRARPGVDSATAPAEATTTSSSGAQASASAPSSSGPGSTAVATTTSSTSAAPAGGAPAVASGPAPSTSAPQAPASRAPTSSASPTSIAAPSAQQNCDPPYAIGMDGVKRYKPWCL